MSGFKGLIAQRDTIGKDAAPATGPEGLEDYNPADYQPEQYRPFTTGKKLPGFSISLVANKARFWIFYHNIGNLKFIEMGGYDHIAFTHQGTAVTIQGKGLLTIFNLIGEGRLKGVFEPNGLPAARPQAAIPWPTIAEIRVAEPMNAVEQLKIIKGSI